jgi:hypothetical protein
MTEPQYTSVRLCAAPDCNSLAQRKSRYCSTHASRLYRHGSFDKPTKKLIHPIVDEVTGCHLWPGYTDEKGYGRLGRDGRGMSAHRYYWIQRHGEIPEGMHLDHLCRNPRCCNPDHLEIVTPGENTLRGNAPTIVANRENRCLRGHELTPENSYRKTDGFRQCRICLRVVNNRSYARRKAARQ